MEIDDGRLSLDFGGAIFVVIFRIDRQYVGEGQAGFEDDIFRLGDIALFAETKRPRLYTRRSTKISIKRRILYTDRPIRY